MSWILDLIDAAAVVRLFAFALALLIGGTLYVTALLMQRNRVRLADDPMLNPFGDMPGFSDEQLRRVARMPIPPHHDDHYGHSLGVALRVKDGGAGFHIPSGWRRRLLPWRRP